MHKQYIYSKTGLLTQMIFIILMSGVIIFASLVWFGKLSLPNDFGIYRRPPIDKMAAEGVPLESDTLGFDVSEISIQNGTSFSMASVLYRQADGSVMIFLTNPAGSGVDLLCEIKDKRSGKTLFKSGRVLAGQYLESLKPKGKWENIEKPIRIYVYSIDPKTYYSRGTIELETTLQPW